MTNRLTVRTTGSCAPLPGSIGLRRVETWQAQCSTIAADPRLPRLLDKWLKPWSIQLATVIADDMTCLVELSCALGQFGVYINPGSAIVTASAWQGLMQLGHPDLAVRLLNVIGAAHLAPLDAPWRDLRVVSVAERRLSQADLGHGISLSVNGLPVFLTHWDDRFRRSLKQALAAHAPRDLATIALGTVGRLRLLTRPLSRSLLTQVRHGDVVLIGRGDGLECDVLYGLGVAWRLATTVHFFERRVVVRSSDGLTPLPDPPHLLEPFMSTSIQDLQLPVTFELDTARVALKDLDAIAPGAVIELDCPLPEAQVRLVCHGQVIGTGQLVAVGENLGVRIEKTQWVSHGASH